MKKRKFAWSLSALKDYERCARLYAWRRVEKRYEAPSAALERGERIHKMMENAILHDEPLPKGLQRYKTLIDELAAHPHKQVEQMWCFDRELRQVDTTDFGNTWLRVKMDLFAWNPDSTAAYALDWKTGNIYPDHDEGMQVYAWAAMQRYPSIEAVEVELVYLDQRQSNVDEVTAEGLEKSQFGEKLLTRVDAMERAYDAGEFPPTPGNHCKWCPWGKRRHKGDGSCPDAA